MNHCFLCGGNDFPAGSMVMAKGGAHICQNCAQTERGKRLVQALFAKPDNDYRESHGGTRFQRAMRHWLRSPRWTR